MASPTALGSAAQPRLQTVAELLADLRDGSLRLEPDRTGAPEWPEHRKRLLLDSVLRGWPIGSIYVLVVPGQPRTVVDGGQRLTALLEFVAGAIDVDGRMAPRDDMLREADGHLYTELPTGLRSAIDEYPLVVIEFHGLIASELRPALFRLNGADRLSTAQRKVMESGALGEQIRELVVSAANWGLTSDRIGFSNAALAYEDVLTRVMLAAESGDVRSAANNSPLAKERFADGRPVSGDVYQEVAEALRDLLALPALDEPAVRFGKATLVSWLLLLVYAKRQFGPSVEHYAGYLVDWFEPQRRRLAAGLELGAPAPLRGAFALLPAQDLLSVFNERSAIETFASESVVIRDAILWLFLVGVGGAPAQDIPPVPLVLALRDGLSQGADLDSMLAGAGRGEEWGHWE